MPPPVVWQVEALLLEACNPTKPRRQGRKGPRDGSAAGGGGAKAFHMPPSFTQAWNLTMEHVNCKQKILLIFNI